MNEKTISIEANVNASIQKVWDYYTQVAHVMQWNNASADWHTPNATNDLQVGGKFVYTMSAKDGSFSFDFSGTYTTVNNLEQINYTLDDERKVEIFFTKADDSLNDSFIVKIIFEPETQNTLELQQAGWQAILDNFKDYVENN